MHHYKLLKRAVSAFIEELFRNFADYHFSRPKIEKFEKNQKYQCVRVLGVFVH